jgi:hypothetical protein
MHEELGITIRSMDDLGRLSKVLAESKFFNDTQSAAQVGVKVLAGIEMGFSPIAAMTGIHIVKGKVQIGANLLAAAIKRSERYDYRVAKDKDGNLRFNDKECVLVFYERRSKNDEWEETGISSFNEHDAQLAGTQNVQKFPRNMFFARAMSNGVKWFCPDVFLGISAYTEGEIEEIPEQGIPTIPDDVLDAVAVMPDTDPAEEVEPVDLEFNPNQIFNDRIEALGIDYKTARKYLKDKHKVNTPAELEPGDFEVALLGLAELADYLEELKI